MTTPALVSDDSLALEPARSVPQDLSVLRGAKVLLIQGTLELAGAERQALNLARYLRDRLGCQVEFWGLRDPGSLSALCDQLGFPWRLHPLEWPQHRLGRLREVLRFARALRAARPDVLLPYTPLPNLLCGLTWRLAGARTCVWSHRSAHPFAPGPRLERLAIRSTPCVVSNSRHAVADLERRYGLAPESVHVVYNGVAPVPPVLDRTAWRARLGVPDDVFVATMVAVVRRDKDHRAAVRAWSHVLRGLGDRAGKALLVFAGRLEDEADPAKALAFDLGLGSSVRFLGHVDDVSGLLAASDLGVFTTRYEGLPNGVLECMAAGLMVVAGDHPGVREALGHADAACLAPPSADEALAGLILRAMREPALRREHGERNRRRVETDFGFDQMCLATAKLIAASWRGARSS